MAAELTITVLITVSRKAGKGYCLRDNTTNAILFVISVLKFLIGG